MSVAKENLKVMARLTQKSMTEKLQGNLNINRVSISYE